MKWNIDWHTAFVPSVSPLEIVLRGSVMYLSLFVILRVILKRQSGTFATADLLLIVLIADASQNGMSADYHSITDGLLLVLTLTFWNYAMDWLGYHIKAIDRLLQPPPLLLIKDGQMLRRNMRQELITVDELMAHLREEGVDDVSGVRAAYMEGDGQISVLRKEPNGGENVRPRKKLS